MPSEVRYFQLPPEAPRWARDVADYLSGIGREWAGFALQDGVTVSVDFVAGTVVVPHKLKRRPRGFVVLQPQDSTYPYATAANWLARDENFLTLTAGASFTSDVWVF